MLNVAQAYKQTQADTIGQGELVVMLFDGALRFLGQAREKMQQKDMAAKGTLISKALDIINELDGSLNMELGGEVAKNLHQLYFICNTRLLQANLRLDLGQLDSVTGILQGLRNAFAEAIQRPEAKAAAAAISAKISAKAPSFAARPLQSHTGPAGSPQRANSLYNMQQGLTRPIMPPKMDTDKVASIPANQAKAESALEQMGLNVAKTFAPQADLSKENSALDRAANALQAMPKVSAAAANGLEQPAELPTAFSTALNAPAQSFTALAGKRMAMYGKLMQGSK